jgi:hypothetical protein
VCDVAGRVYKVQVARQIFDDLYFSVYGKMRELADWFKFAGALGIYNKVFAVV